MAFSARKSLATSLSHHLNRRLHPSLSHLVPSHHDRREDPTSSSAPPLPAQQTPPLPSGDFRRRSRSQSLALSFGAHFLAHRNFSSTTSSSGAEFDAATGVLSDPAAGQMDVAAGVLSDAASAAVPALPAYFPGEVAAAAADSVLPVQYLIDAVHSFTGLNWWVSIALTTVLVRTAMIPLQVHQIKSEIKYKALVPEVKAINKDMLNSRQERKLKLGELYRKHGVSQLTPFKLLFIQVPILLSFTYAIRNMIENVPSLEGGGAYWFTNLTTPDELYILPVLISIAYVIAEPNIKANKAGSPMQQTIFSYKNLNRAIAVLVMPLSVNICKAHFCYWVPWILFSVACRYTFRQPAVRRYFGIPLVAPPRPAPPSEGPKPVPAVGSPPSVGVSGQSSSESSDRSVDPEKKRRTPRVITNRARE